MRKPLIIGIAIFATFFSASCIVFRPPSYIAGRESFLAGNYSQAFNELLSAAQTGNPNAQYAVGYMYYYGLGILPDRQAAIVWIQRAANQGQPQAMKVLDSLLNTGYTNNSLAKPELLPMASSQLTADSLNPNVNSSTPPRDEQQLSDLTVTRTIKKKSVEIANMQVTQS